jgi:thiamine pyrophosphate-dependent acetolactate synthase large subunit-like protein
VTGRRITGAEALVAELSSLGVEVVFGLPGVHNLAIFDALRRSRIRTIVVRHEQTAGYAADGYARATGRLGVCVTTTGPGAANAAAAMGEARASRSPVLHVSTQVETRILEGRSGRFALHESPQQVEMMAAVSLFAARVSRAEAIPSMVARAAQEAFAGRRGPAFLEIPHDLLSASVPREPAAIPAPPRPPTPAPDRVAEAARVLAAARRPVVWAGGGVLAAEAHAALVRVAEALDAPVVETFAGKGAMPPGHPLALGLPPHQPEVTSLIARSDAALVVGSDLDGPSTQNWRLPLPRPRVVVNVCPDDLRRNYAADVAIAADARLALEALAEALPPRRPGPGARRVARCREAAWAALRAVRELREPLRFVERLRAAVPAEAVVVGDMAVPGYWTAAYLPAAGPRTVAFPLGWGTLGFALPAAVGVAAAGRRAVVVAGDGGLQFAPAELGTVAEEGLDVSVVVVTDDGYGMLRYDEDERFGERFACDLKAPDFVALARAFGVPARRTTLETLERDLRWATRRPGPSLLELRAAWPPPLTTSPRWPLRGRPEARP